MLATDLKESLIKKISPLYIVSGEDGYLRNQALKTLSALAGEEFPEFNLVTLDGTASLKSVLDSYAQIPFMSDRRVTIVRDWTAKFEEEEAAKEFIAKLKAIDNSVLVLVYSSKAPTELKKCGVVVDCKKLGKGEVGNFVIDNCTKKGYKITGGALNKLVEYTSCNLGRVSGELDKLFGFCVDNMEIEENAVEVVVSKDLEYAVYALSNAVADGRRDEALKILYSEQGDTGKSLGMLTMLTNQFRKMLHILLNKNMDVDELCSLLDMRDFAVEKNLRIAKKFKQNVLKNIVDRLEDVEYEYKSGRILTADEALFIGVESALQIMRG